MQTQDKDGKRAPDRIALRKIISVKETARIRNLSRQTLWRQHKRGEGPSRVQLSDGRVGYWLDEILEL